MQRKNSILKKRSRNGIAMIMAIAVLVIIATILALSLSLTNKTTQKTTDLYLYEQASILTHSAAEYALLKMSQSNQCSLPSINYSYNNIYDINTTMYYISTPGSICEANTPAGHHFATVTYPGSNGTVILDVSVTTKNGISTEPIRYFRRTIQKL